MIFIYKRLKKTSTTWLNRRCVMSKARNKKVTLNQLNNHTTTNKRQAMKDLKMLNFDELVYRNAAQKRFYNT